MSGFSKLHVVAMLLAMLLAASVLPVVDAVIPEDGTYGAEGGAYGEEVAEPLQPLCSSNTCSDSGMCCEDWNICECTSDDGNFKYTCPSSKPTRSLRQQETLTRVTEFVPDERC